MEFHELGIWRNFRFPIDYLKCDPDVLHLLFYGILPEGIPVFFVDFQCPSQCLWYFDTEFVVTAAIMWSLFLSTYGAHHINAGLLLIPWVLAYSAAPTGYDSLTSASRSQDVVPSFHCRHSSNPLVVFRKCRLFPFRTYMSDLSFASFSFRWAIIMSINRNWLPSRSH